MSHALLYHLPPRTHTKYTLTLTQTHTHPPTHTQHKQKILKAVQVASETINHLSEPESLDEESVQSSYEDYLDLMKEIHEGLASRANWIKNYVPYHRHTGELRQEVKALEVRVEVLREEARRLGYKEKEGEEAEEGKREARGQGEKEDAMETTA